jgi:hypothetical protein
MSSSSKQPVSGRTATTSKPWAWFPISTSFSPNAVGDFSGMVRDNANDLSSNPNSTPVIAFQSNSFREGYFKATVWVHHGRQEWKAGVESDIIFLHERFNDPITDFS